MTHLYTDCPHIGIALSRHEEVLWNPLMAVKSRSTGRSCSICESAQFFGLFVVIHGRERPGSHPVRLARFDVVVEKICTTSSETILLATTTDSPCSSSSSSSSSSSLSSTTASTSRYSASWINYVSR